MTRGLVKPAQLGRLRSFLLLLEADLWGPEWLLIWLDQDDPQRTLSIRVIRSIIHQPQRWSENIYGLTNQKDKLGVYTAEGWQSLALAADADKQFYPSAYWRWMINRIVRWHRRWNEEEAARKAAARLSPRRKARTARVKDQLAPVTSSP
jgi:hypothetical protein